MTKPPKRSIVAPAPQPLQPTQPPARDTQGFELDQWGLPICGPIRRQRLVEMGRPEPLDAPEAWAEAEATTLALSLTPTSTAPVDPNATDNNAAKTGETQEVNNG